MQGVAYGTTKQRLPQAASLSYEEEYDMPDMPNIWDKLQPTINKYNEWHENMVQINDPDNAGMQKDAKWNDFNPDDVRKDVVKTLNDQINKLDPEADKAKISECSFISSALDCGWLVSDVEMLRDLYGVVQNLPEGTKIRADGERMLSKLSETNVERVVFRREATAIIGRFNMELKDYCRGTGTQMTDAAIERYNKLFPEKYHELNSANKPKLRGFVWLDRLNEKELYPEEFPLDDEFNNLLPPEKMRGTGLDMNSVYNDDRYNDVMHKLSNFYVNAKMSPDELRERKKAPLVPLAAHKHNDIKKKTSQAMTDVFGGDAYDDIDERYLGKAKDRRFYLYRAGGSKLAREGKDVVQMNFPGSGAKGESNVQAGRVYDGDLEKRLTEEEIARTYGKKVTLSNGTVLNRVRYRTSQVTKEDGTKITKERYLFPGVHGPLNPFGWVNLGTYSVESMRDYAQDIAHTKLKAKINQWLAHKNDHSNLAPAMTVFDLWGHSRGAVTAVASTVAINQWITDYMTNDLNQSEEQIKEFKEKCVSYNLRLDDSVAGFITDLHKGKMDLHAIPNVNVTACCSLGIAEPDSVFPMQQVMGANKVILSVRNHQDFTGYDTTQSELNHMDIHSERMNPYFDAETGEMYRQSGLNDLADGIYISDENNNMLRIHSYNHLLQVYDSVFQGADPQKTRTQRIHEMVRDWFCEHELEMSFPDEITHKREEEKFLNCANHLLADGSERLRPVKEALKALNEVRKRTVEANNEVERLAKMKDLSKANKVLMDVCRNYMRGTTMPPSDEKEARTAGRVGDVLSFAMREKNYFNKRIIEKQPDPAGEFKYDPTIDNKIAAFNERLEKKPGHLDRKIEAETKRNELLYNSVVPKMGRMIGICKAGLEKLDTTRTGKKNSAEYNELHRLMKYGRDNIKNMTMNEFASFCKKLNKVAKYYSDTHDILIGPVTKDGKTRLKWSNIVNTATKDLLNEAEKEWTKTEAGLSNRDVPVVTLYKLQKKRITELNDKKLKLHQEKEQNAPENVQPNANEVNPNANEVNPIANEVNPIANEVNPNANEVNPNANEVHPIANEVHPNANEVNPNANEVHPNANEVHPNANEVHPKVKEVKKAKVLGA